MMWVSLAGSRSSKDCKVDTIVSLTEKKRRDAGGERIERRARKRWGERESFDC